MLRADAPQLADGLFGRALPVVALSVLAGVASIVLLVLRRYAVARVTAALAVAAILLGWAAAQYPYVLPPDLTIEDAAAGQATLVAMLVVAGHRLVRARARARLPLPTLPTRGKDHAVSVQKAVELIGTGPTIQDAVTEALDRARLTLDGITSFEMADVTGVVDGASVEYRVELRVWFTLLERMHG